MNLPGWRAMFLVEFLLPVFDNHGVHIPKDEFGRVRRELTDRFGGVTAFMRSPAMGLWADESGAVRRDDLVSFEVMAESLDRDWWRDYRQQLARRFRQQEIVMRAISFERL
jgi:hypothetical protein